MFDRNRTTADGNCLFNACCLALVGEESVSSCLRCLTSIELYINADFYASHQTIKECHAEGAFFHECNAFVATSFTAADVLSAADRVSAIKMEAKETAQNCRVSSFMSMLGLSSVVRQPIESYFPVKDPRKFNSYERLFNCTIVPRQYSSVSAKIHIFCCAIVPVDFLFHNNIPEQKNQYVPLVNVSVDEQSTKGKVYYARSSTKKSESNDSRQVIASGKLKRKQTTIDFNVKKRNPDAIGNLQEEAVDKKTTDPLPSLSSDYEHSSNDNNEIVSRDVGQFYNLPRSSFSDQTNYNLLCHAWRLDPAYLFPTNSLGRKVQYSDVQEKCLGFV